MFVLARPTHASKAGASESCPKSLAVDIALQTLDYFLEQPSERLPDDLQGPKLGLKLELCRLTNELERFYHPQNHSINCREFEFFLSPLLMPNLSQAK